jgi:hypothetical protein
MSHFEKALRDLRAELEALDARRAKVVAAVEVLEELGGAREVIAAEPRGPRRTAAKPAKKPPPDRREAIATAASKQADGKCDGCARKATVEKRCPCGYVVRGCADHGGKALGGRWGGHARRCPKSKRPTATKPAAKADEESEPVAPVIELRATPRVHWRQTLRGTSGRQRLYRCTVQVAEEFGRGAGDPQPMRRHGVGEPPRRPPRRARAR